MGVSSERAYTIRCKMADKLYFLLATTRREYLTHEESARRIHEDVFNSPEAKKAPRYVREYIRGRFEEARAQIMLRDVEWCVSIDGTFYTGQEREALTQLEADLIRCQAVRGVKYLDYTEYQRRLNLARSLCAQVSAGTYNEPIHRINHDLSGYFWKGTNGNVMKDKRYL